MKQILLQFVFVCVLGVAAYAQYTISPGSGFCMTHTADSANALYTFTATGSHSQGTPAWSVLGDLQLVSQSTTSAVVRSTGYGKGRVILTYNQQTSAVGDTVYADVYKTFAARGQIAGPSCVSPGQLVTFSVPPVISTAAQLQAGIGSDGYRWFINGQPAESSAWWVVSSDSSYTSGDGSSITLVAPQNIGEVTQVSVAVGHCNAAQLSLTVNASNIAFFIENFGCGLFRVRAPGFVREGSTYEWFLDDVLIGTTSGVQNSFGYDSSWTGLRTVSVRVRKGACLDALVVATGQAYDCESLRSGAAFKMDGVAVYPNPVSSELNLTLPKDGAVKQILLTDDYGNVQKRLTTEESLLTVDVSTLPPGLYILTVKTGKQTVTKKLKLER